MVSLLPPGDFHAPQRAADCPPLADWPTPPLALKSGVTMLDSGGMSESDNKPPTLASLRARRGKLRAGKRPPPPPSSSDSQTQAGLFSAISEVAPWLDSQLAKAS